MDLYSDDSEVFRTEQVVPLFWGSFITAHNINTCRYYSPGVITSGYLGNIQPVSKLIQALKYDNEIEVETY